MTTEKAVAPAALVAPTALAAPVTAPSLVTGLLAALGTSLLATNTPVAPAEVPVLWGLLAWVRRQNQQTLIDKTTSISQIPAQSGQTVDDAMTDITALSAPVTVNVAAAARRRHGRCNPAGFCAGECGDAADQSIRGRGYFHRRAGGREHQHRGHRLEQHDLEYHLGHRLGR